MAIPLLIVDDSAISRKMIKKSLPETWDVSITEAANGVEALEAYRAGKADIMFLDLTMPVMDGYQVLETLKKEGLNSFVIVISADIQPKARERVMQLGAIDFIQKPIDNQKLTDVLTKYGIEL
ncbi:MAG: response regulator [Pseudomonadota bacterium]